MPCKALAEPKVSQVQGASSPAMDARSCTSAPFELVQASSVRPVPYGIPGPAARLANMFIDENMCKCAQ